MRWRAYWPGCQRAAFGAHRWGYYFRVGVLLTVPVLLVTLAALAVRLLLG